MKLHIDWTSCDGRGLCTELLPELLDRDDWGYPVPREGPEPTVPVALRSVARRAVTQCPRLALQLLTDEGPHGRVSTGGQPGSGPEGRHGP
jgi:ferredoxin